MLADTTAPLLVLLFPRLPLGCVLRSLDLFARVQCGNEAWIAAELEIVMGAGMCSALCSMIYGDATQVGAWRGDAWVWFLVE